MCPFLGVEEMIDVSLSCVWLCEGPRALWCSSVVVLGVLVALGPVSLGACLEASSFDTARWRR